MGFPMPYCSVLFALFMFIVALDGHQAGSPQGEATTPARDGVFSEAQSARGEDAYRSDCGSCHGEDLTGSGQAPPLADEQFRANWSGAPLAELFDRIQTTMPADRPGQLTRERTADIVAFVLKANG